MRKLLNRTILLLSMHTVSGLASYINDGGSDQAGKWQLRKYRYPDGEVQKVDNTFYGFQRGSFLAYRMNKSGGYEGLYGYYGLKNDEISITLWLDNNSGDGAAYEGLVSSVGYKNFSDWGDADERALRVEELTGKKMQLNYEGTKYVFRRYQVQFWNRHSY